MNSTIKYILIALFAGLQTCPVLCQTHDEFNQKSVLIDSALFRENPNQAVAESIRQISDLFQAGEDSLATQYCIKYCDLLEKTGHIHDAQKLAKTAMALAPKNTSQEIILLSLFGGINAKLGNFELAKQDLEKTLALSDQLHGDQSDMTAEIKANLASVYMSLGAYETALQYFQESLTALEALYGQDHVGTQKIYENTGIIYTYLGRFDEAIQSQKKGIELVLGQPGVDSVNLAASYSNLAFSYGQMGDSYESLALYLKCLEINKRHLPNDHYLVVRAYNNVGAILTRMGDFNRALNYHKEALHLIQSNRENVSTPDMGVTYVNLGACSLHQGAYQKGIYYYQKALEFDLKSLPPTHPYIAEDLSYLGDCHFKGKQYDSAIFYHKKALEINLSQFGQKHVAVATSYDNLSKDHQYLQDYEAALEFSEKAITAAQSAAQVNHKLAQSINRKVEVLLELGQAEKATEALQKAFIANTIAYHPSSRLNHPKADYINLETFMTSLSHMNEAFCDLNQALYTQSVMEHHLQLIDFMDSLIIKRRLSHHHYDDKIYFAETSSAFYRKTANHLLHLYTARSDNRFLEKAYLFTVKSNNAILRENLTLKAAREFLGIPDSLNAKESQLRSLISYYQNQLRARDSSALPVIQKKLFQHEEALIQLNDLIAANFPEYYELVNPEEVTITGVMDQIRKDQLIIEYFLSDSSLHIFQIGNHQIKHHRIAYDQALQADIEALITQINSPFEASSIVTFKQVSYRLYQRLLARALSEAAENMKEIILIPAYDLPAFPFDVLISDTTGNNYSDLSYVLKQHHFSYAYSAEIKYQKHKQVARVIAFAPTFNTPDSLKDNRADLPQLEWNKSEVEGVKTHFPSDIYTDEYATEQILKNKQSEYNILHLATHAILDPQNPINSRIAFSKNEADENEDGFLHVFEILNMDIKANLSVLSACNTGLGAYEKGEGIMSLARAFTYAGCQSVLLSHWSIDDQSTSQLMDHFYANLKAGNNKSEALKNAKLSFLSMASEIRSHPYYWSGFSLYGDTNPVQRTPSNPLFMAISVFTFFGFGVVLARFMKKKYSS